MAYIYDIADVWAASGTTFTGIKLNVTDTASAAGSLLMDLQVGGSSILAVRRAAFSGVKTDRPAFIGRQFNYFVTEQSGFFGIGPSEATISVSLVTGSLAGGGGGVDLVSNGFFSWRDSATNASAGNRDLILARDAANTLAQRNGVNAQAFNLYNTYTDASNYERGFMRFVSNVLQIGSEKLGTGTARDLSLQTDGTARMTIAGTTGAVRMHNLGTSAIPSIYWNTLPGTFTNWGFYSVGVGSTSFATGNAEIIRFGGAVNGMCVYDTYAIGTNFAAPNIFLRDEGAGTLGQRNGTNAQTVNLYGTYTDAANYRRLTKTMSTAGVAVIKPEGAGTGASGNVLHISGLPTSNPGPGILWNNAGTPAIGT